jgi:hypothetical protein
MEIFLLSQITQDLLPDLPHQSRPGFGVLYLRRSPAFNSKDLFELECKKNVILHSAELLLIDPK